MLLCHAVAAAAIHDTSTGIFNKDFRTLQLRVNGTEQLPPIIVLDSDDSLDVTFDELSDTRRYMRYELLHCNSRWQPDALVAPEYLNGFNEGIIDDYEFSQATTTHYVHYSIHIPDPGMKPLLSGNYLLRVYDEQEPDETLLQARFSIVEPKVKAYASVTSRTDKDYNDAHQQLTLTIDTEGTDIRNAFSDLTVVIEQNGRTDNAVTLTTPTRVTGKEIVYEHNPAMIFPAGNEYRRMEVVSVTYPGMGVESLGYADPFYHATLYTDTPRSHLPYTFDRTQHGRFRVREYNSTTPDTEADYIVVHFSLDIPEMRNADIFLDGDMTLRRFDPESRMVYNRATGLYETSLLLKQGAYNYQYLTVPFGSMTGFTAPVEGDCYQTSNEYVIKIYYREPGARYDRLIGVTSVYSGT